MRSPEELQESGLQVVERAYQYGALEIRPLFSGGHDSLCAVHLASQHPRFKGTVYHINTGIGAAYTRRFVESVCEAQGWMLQVFKSKDTYEQFIRDRGFPGPGRHDWVYNRLKGRCVQSMVKGRAPKAMITGCRSQESVRRMGVTAAIQMGEVDRKTGKRFNLNRIWTAPCHDWSTAEQQLYMDEFGLPINKFKVAVGLSGECGCGAFAAPGEEELWREHAPEVGREIDRLTIIAKECGMPCEWGKRPQNGEKTAASTGPLCSSCDRRALAAGFVLTENDCEMDVAT